MDAIKIPVGRSGFADIRKESSELFAGLSIMEETDLCAHWMDQYPTLFLSFKSADGLEHALLTGYLTRIREGQLKEPLPEVERIFIMPFLPGCLPEQDMFSFYKKRCLVKLKG